MLTPVPNLAAAPAPVHPMPAAEVVFWIIAGLLIYLTAHSVSVRRHPYRPCSKCGESGKHRGTVFSDSFRACNRCGGTGRELRPGAKHPAARTGGTPRAFEPRPDRTARKAARRAERSRDH